MPIAFLKRLSRHIFGSPARAGKPGPVAKSMSVSSGEPRRRQRRRRKRPVAQSEQLIRPAQPDQAPSAQESAAWTQADHPVPEKAGSVRFHDLGLPDPLMRGIHECGFSYCTPIQAKVLARPDDSDLTGRAQTGTGKTAAFLILLFRRFLENPRSAHGGRPARPRALVIAPTRELTVQIVEEADMLGRYAGFRSLAVYGGMDMDKQERELTAEAPDLVAATPGRLLDFVRRGVIDLSAVEVFVVDEADRMLDMGFIPDVRRIVGKLPGRDNRRTLLFSATLTSEVRMLAGQWMKNAVVVEVEPENVAVQTVDQVVYAVASKEKFAVLYNILRKPEATKVLVFVNRRDRTRDLVEMLGACGLSTDMLSGDVEQKKRLKILDAFRDGRLGVLVATDVAGRGIHVDSISHVVNYDFPYEPEDYVHRIGRTGRAGQRGVAVSLACEDESFVIPEIEKYIGRSLPCSVPPEDLLQPAPEAAFRRRREQRPERGRSGYRPGAGRPRHPRR
ncbi:MAG: DEAD/DEAH box helicase [Lentisphaerae bacterium]|nr:DEAD/DEAH box helicase [Lentisphaerota bacterium]